MKKFISIFSILMFILFSIKTVTAFAVYKVSKQGFYTMKDLNLTTHIIYYIQNTSQSTPAIVLILDSNQVTAQSISLNPQSQKYALIPLQYDYTIVILGNAELEIS